MKNLSIYMHIPFCKKKCSYCDFVSVAKPRNFQEKYVNSLLLEIENSKTIASTYNLNTIYIGGGTPSYLDIDLIERILVAINNVYDLSVLKEFTFECNPESIDKDKLVLLKRYGVNRLSIGLQSANEDELVFLRRSHDYPTFLRAYTMARSAGFDNISIDLMFAIPGQSEETFLNTLEKTVLLSPEHISCYSLIVEDKTLMHRWLDEKKIELPSDELYLKMYHMAINYFKKHGYEQYEISNFCKVGFESIHNTAYWLRDDYLGLGAASHSLINGSRFSNLADIDSYIEKLEDKEYPTDLNSVEKLTAKDIVNEMMFLGMRMNKGISIISVKNEMHKLHALSSSVESTIDFFDEKITSLSIEGLVDVDGDILKLTQKGREISNTVFAELMVE